MARIAGRNGRLYLAIASNGTPTNIASVKSFEISAQTATYDATCYGDANLVKVAGLSDASGKIDGVFDTSVSPTWAAAQDGQSRGFYFYHDTVNDASHYWYGSILLDFSGKFPVDGVAEFSANWNASGPITKV